MAHPEIAHNQERHPAHVSVALLLDNDDHSLVLVRQRNSGQWGLVAGRLERNETHEQALWRELEEETGMDEVRLQLISPRPKVITLPIGDKTSVGLIFRAKMISPLPAAGYEINDEDIDLVRPFRVAELLDLRKHPESIYRPEFNQPMVDEWLLDYILTKYGTWEGMDFARDIARAWGLNPSSQQDPS